MAQLDKKANSTTKLKKAYLALTRMEARLEKTDLAAHEPLAIVGMGCRFPGGIDSPEAFWENLTSGKDVIQDEPSNRWPDCFDPDPNALGKMYTTSSGLLENPYGFDPEFFGITPREAIRLDPQHRLLLEVAWETLENSGTAPSDLKGSKTGVFLGISTFDYAGLQFRQPNMDQIDAYFITGSYPSMAAGRLAYSLGLNGPVMAVDTACSSSLLALHLASRSLRRGECTSALVGGVNLILTPEMSVNFCKNRMLSPEGRCFTFDARANGYVRGEGCGVVMLKRLSDARKEGDRIIAAVMGTATNHDGASAGLTVPSGLAQESVIRSALNDSRIRPDQVTYVEAHGTGTSLGDPIEMEALGNVFRGKRPVPLLVGAVKTNLGHTEAAAGIAGVLKTALMIEKGVIPPHLNFETPNEKIDWERLSVEIPTKTRPWLENGSERLAGVSAFGASGTNVHAILGDVREQFPGKSLANVQPQTSRLLVLSARSESVLATLAERYGRFLERNPLVDPDDLCRTAALGRSHFDHRLALVGSTVSDFSDSLDAWKKGDVVSGISHGKSFKKPKIAWIFTGQGSQYAGMGKELYRSEPVFKKTIDRCEEILNNSLERPLCSVMFPKSEQDSELIHQTRYTQPALFAFEYALAELFKSWGLYPHAVMGHSVGEYAAACVAGVMSLEEGLGLIAERGRLMGALPRGGKMAAVMAPGHVVETFIESVADKLSVAAFNGPGNTVISGEESALEKVLTDLAKEGVSSIPLEVSHAFHSPLMFPMMEEFRQIARDVTFKIPHLTLVSNITGQKISENQMDANYWMEHVRKPVGFAQSMQTLWDSGYTEFVEIGPKPILTGMGKRCITDPGAEFLPTVQPGDNGKRLLMTLGHLYSGGQKVNWRVFSDSKKGAKISLPTYPFQRRQYRMEVASQTVMPDVPKSSGAPLLGRMLDVADSSRFRFESRIHQNEPAFLGDHVIHGMVIMPATGYVSMAVAAGQELLAVETVVLKNLTMQHPMMFPEGVLRRVQTTLTKEDSGEYDFKVFTKPVDEDSQTPWLKHIQGKISSDKPITPGEFQNLDDIKSSLIRKFSVKKLYGVYLDCGLELGPDFKTLREIWVGSDQSLGKVIRPESLTDDGAYLLHPALLDACFQTAGPLFLDFLDTHNYLPVSIDKVTYLAPMGEITYCHAHMPDLNTDIGETGIMPETLIADFSLYDDLGRPLARIQGLTFRRTGRDAILKSIKDSGKNLLYHVRWQTRDLVPVNTAPAEETWVVLSDSNHTVQIVNNHLAGNVHVIKWSDLNLTDTESLKIRFDTFGIKPGNSWRLLALFENGKSSGTSEQIASLTEDVCVRFLNLVQSTLRLPVLPELWIFTVNAQPVPDQPIPDQPESLNVCQAPLWAMVETLCLEHPELHSGIMDIMSLEDHELLAKGFQAIRDAGPEKRLAIRKDELFVPRIKELPPLELKLSDENGKKSLFNPDACYLITGGLGALGRQVALWMASEGARYLVFCGRNRPKENTESFFDDLSERGIQSIFIKTDVSSRDDVADLFKTMEQESPPLKGIIHAAGILKDGMMLTMTQESMEMVLAPKVKGTLYLRDVASGLDLDFWIGFSSMASVLGSRGQVNYAAANGFLDSITQNNDGPARRNISINWGPWQGDGMAGKTDSQSRSLWKQRGIDLIFPDKALATMGELLADDRKHVGISVLPVRWPVYLSKTYGGSVPPFYEKIKGISLKPVAKTSRGQLLKMLQAAESAARHNLLMESITKLISTIMQLDSGVSMEPRQRLFDSGMDSLMAIEFKDQLEGGLDTTLSATLVFDYPTVEAIIIYLEREILPPGLMSGEEKETLEEFETDRNIDITDDMDEEELAELLAGELDDLEQEY